ncbi:bifunctional pyr operon transcriptional regulator/uracil phosphoribosyltransferase [Candidatus Desantisbacteria bacterium CG1_02_38_46]|uniref:Bifunctional protein PyrR n=2 Tax=unclassified Candidatus Desantisiibacteriota TaxID=3106372 RepID=A0A1J4SER2_9BACT|nr:MAG: bifunctional pyr operon transcriptional regulator/uracil phosphoribosyltransferase [Candidatus Desantisbacteria bacterium CG1_02_38_46]PIU51269.1 MAG: bifunctional pyr operon transcriptional regulator/uracil phosphoribosyltransferase PyrR [Candidatus Desantisbacteria bacterium CG07_land_8_20_14_0_80_39_15]
MKDKLILDKKNVGKTISALCDEIIKRNQERGSLNDLVIIGIRTRGAHLAERIVQFINRRAEVEIPLGILDITLYRDDLTTISAQPIVRSTEISFDLTDKKVVLVDDVLYTGRTIRSAMDELIDFGRPKNIQLAVLIDRGHRELPIQADYVGKIVPTKKKEIIEVRLAETDGKDEVVLKP